MEKKPEDYKHIALWGKQMKSYDYYIKQEQVKCARLQAPLNTVYFNGDKPVTFDEVKNQAVIEQFKQAGLEK
jgi:hypothetical protein